MAKFLSLATAFLADAIRNCERHIPVKLIFKFIYPNLFIGTQLLKVFAFAILALNSRRYWYSKIDSPLSTMYIESPTPRIGDTASPLQKLSYTVYTTPCI
jgi:hypothetical protein